MKIGKKKKPENMPDVAEVQTREVVCMPVVIEEQIEEPTLSMSNVKSKLRMCHRHHHRFMILVVLNMIPGTGYPLQVILSMIKTQFEEHISLKSHSNLIHMTLRKDQLGVENVHSILCGFIIIVGLNIVSRRNLHFALYVTCSKRKKLVVRELMHLLMVVGVIGIERMLVLSMLVA